MESLTARLKIGLSSANPGRRPAAPRPNKMTSKSPMKALLAPLAALALLGATTAQAAATTHYDENGVKYSYTHAGHHYKYRYHGEYYNHRSCRWHHSHKACKYW